MVGAHAATKLATSEDGAEIISQSGKITNKALSVLNAKLDKHLEELKSK